MERLFQRKISVLCQFTEEFFMLLFLILLLRVLDLLQIHTKVQHA